MLSTAMDPPTFIRANTKLLSVPLVPEVRLHIAEESLPIWQRTEEELGAMNVPPPYWAFAWAGGQALARFLLDNTAMVADRCVLDLGSGSDSSPSPRPGARGAACWRPTSMSPRRGGIALNPLQPA
jgi:predicted nicotinamide N-methyase